MYDMSTFSAKFGPAFQVLCASLMDWMNSLDKGFTAKIVEIAVQSTAMYAKFFIVKTGLEYNLYEVRNYLTPFYRNSYFSPCI
jgi:hypothetical protein